MTQLPSNPHRTLLAAALDKAKRLRKELADAEAEAKRYGAAIGKGGNLETLVALLAQAEARRDNLRRELDGMQASPALEALSSEHLERELRDRANYWREVLTEDVPLAR